MSSAPRPDFSLYLQSLSLWTAHSDATIISTEVPWDSLLNGENPVTYVMGNYAGLVNYCRSANLKLWVYIDPANGLNRQSDSYALVLRGKSIAQADMPRIFEPFFRGARPMGDGTGLGLSIVERICKRLKATVTVENIGQQDAPVGLRVTVQVPLAA